jgi:hypothetical protein
LLESTSLTLPHRPVVVVGAHFGAHKTRFHLAYNYIEKIQMTAFTLQEFILSGLYIYQTLQILRSRVPAPASNTVNSSNSTHRIMTQLLGINVIIIGLDIGLLALEYLDLRIMVQTFKGVTYSVKLKLEFAILSKLVEVTRDGGRGSCVSGEWADTGEGGRANGFCMDCYHGDDNTSAATGTVLSDKPCGSRPRWLEEVEKDGVEHVERVNSGTRSRRSEADLLYADAMRSLDR